MNETVLLEWLFRASVVILGGTAGVLLVRRWFARAFGAKVAYGTWVMLPMMLVGTVLSLPTPIALATEIPSRLEISASVSDSPAPSARASWSKHLNPYSSWAEIFIADSG